MLKLASDADFNGPLCRALLRRQPDLDLVRVQDAGLRTAPDPDVLAWAAAEGRVLLTHDRKTMPGFAGERIAAGLPMPGMIVVRHHPDRIGALVEDILIAALCSTQEEWQNRVEFLPL
jgi:predicted nuclease of predicted toxin-antitoxin system